MDLPSIVSFDMKDLKGFKSDQELYNGLIGNTDRLIRFITLAAEDETWSARHLPFYQLVFLWATTQYELNRVGDSFATALLNIIKGHFEIFREVIPRTLTVKVGSLEILANPLILGQSSPYFKNIIRSEGQSRGLIEVKGLDGKLIDWVCGYIESGDIGNIWKWEKKEILALLETAERLGVKELKKECQEIYARYIAQDNVQKELLSALKTGRKILLEKSIDVINKMGTLQFSSPSEGSLACEFFDFKENSLVAFEPFKSVITHLILGGKLTQDPQFIQVMEGCPKLRGLILAGSEEWSPHFSSIPRQVYELDLGRCSWLGNSEMRKLAELLSWMNILSLSQDTQLTFVGLGELKKFHSLKKLDLSQCHQIGDSELSLIIQSTPQLTDLNLQGCRKLSDQIFFELAKGLRGLEKINVSRTQITDGALIEIGSRLQRLQEIALDHCLNISEAGLNQLLKNSANLTKLSLKDSRFSLNTLQAFRSTYPKVEILD